VGTTAEPLAIGTGGGGFNDTLDCSDSENSFLCAECSRGGTMTCCNDQCVIINPGFPQVVDCTQPANDSLCRECGYYGVGAVQCCVSTPCTVIPPTPVPPHPPFSPVPPIRRPVSLGVLAQ
jgi:hypothetical protein